MFILKETKTFIEIISRSSLILSINEIEDNTLSNPILTNFVPCEACTM